MATTTHVENELVDDKLSINEVIQETAEITEQVGEYGSIISGSLYLILGGMLVIYILHKLVSKLIYPHLTNPRLIQVAFGTLYVLILVVVMLIALRAVGFDVTLIGKASLLAVLAGGVIVFFLVPFFPRFPFKIGHMVECNGVLGIVDSISSFHTTIRKFDGTMVFIPNALVIASKILNYHDLPERRVEIKLSVNTDCDLRAAKELILKIMNEDERVLDKPAVPMAFIITAQASGVDIMAICWVANSDWFPVRSDLWLKIVDAFSEDARVAMSLPQQEVYVIDNEE